MLAWPSFILAKRAFPEAEIQALVPSYTAPMAELCTGIDRVIIDPGRGSGVRGFVTLVRRLKEAKPDVVVALFSTTRVAMACLLAGIPYRLAPATKVAQWLFNQREEQRRSRSEKPEYAYNLDLMLRLLRDRKITPPPLPAPPYLTFPGEKTRRLREQFCKHYRIDPGHRLVFVHPGSGGSAINLSLDQYARLLRALRSRTPLFFVISSGPGEEEYARSLSSKLTNLPNIVYGSRGGLQEFARCLAFADLFISGSTGPLHIAGALDRPTAAFYPLRRSATALRWQTLNSPERRLAFSPPYGSETMEKLDIDEAARQINSHFLGVVY